MKAYERFLKYISIHTKSDGESETVPSSAIQFDLARVLGEELTALGCQNVTVDDKCYVYAEIPATEGYEDRVRLGFIAHMDTAPEFSGENVKPQIIENYDGGKVALGTSGRVLDPAVFPHLASLAGRTLITTDGTTLLGADDKAGVAEIMTMAERILSENIPHGRVAVAFTPDEEVGRGADHFDVERFGCDYAYTADGNGEGELEYENFNACGAHFEVRGFNVHPGTAKNVMINAALVAMEINAMLPAADTPAHTEGYEGFYHVTGIKGDCESAQLDYIVRDHDLAMFEARKTILRHVEKTLNEKYGQGTVTLTLHDQYRNMKEKIEPCFHLIENAKLAAERCGITPCVVPIRGGTDGARLSYMGLPCPNLGTGGNAYHGPFEHITVEGMEKASDMLVELARIYAEIKRD